MDTNAGQFVQEDRAEQWMQRLTVGEIVKIKDEELEVVKIEGRECTLKLRSAAERFGEVDMDALRESLRVSSFAPVIKGKDRKLRDKRKR